ncbi:MAG: UDP-N-acetylmuramoyl-L-alanine--D-glutamate ligase [Dehalococcoidia bacterium]|nr:UDP-N-acetylmuramoyl-L-alanine--D-glutamate ligase [Dehalococcoidia bacterium]
MTDMQNLLEARVTVVGLGIEGIDLVRFLAAEGARVTVSDARPAEQLTDQLAAIERSGARLSLGANRVEDCAGAEAVFVSQGVPAELPALRAAEAAGIPISSMLELFLDRCPAPVAGITGSAGKTTTTALVGAMLEAAGAPHVVGGNIGIGLLSLLREITAATKVVVEMSHTQLARIARSPEVACVTNVTPNHLDRFSWEEYVDLKRRIFRFQRAEDRAVFNYDNDVSRSFMDEAPGRVYSTSRLGRIPGDGAMIEGDRIVRVTAGTTAAVMRRDEITLRGDHNVENVLSAVAVAGLLGVSEEATARAVRAFTGVAHRLEPIATIGGVQYVNDSIATAPERTLAGMRSFAEPLVLLLGGRDKNLPARALGEEAVRRCRAVITFGEASDLYATAIREAAGSARVTLRQVADVPSAVQAAAELAHTGDVVLFSPAGTSFDAYRNFEARGRAFRDAVRSLGGRR